MDFFLSSWLSCGQFIAFLFPKRMAVDESFKNCNFAYFLSHLKT